MDIAEKINFSDSSLYINSELSWLSFNERVLAQAKDERHPLLERVRFVAISETNLNEFFMIRVVGLQQQVTSELPNPSPDGITPEEQLRCIHEHTGRFERLRSQSYALASLKWRRKGRRPDKDPGQGKAASSVF